MMMKILATQTLAAALFAFAPIGAFSQENVTPEEVVKHHPAALPSSSNRSLGKPGSPDGIISVEDADVVTVAPAVPSGLSSQRSNNKARYLSAREDVRPIVVQFSGKDENVDTFHEDLSILTLRIRKALEGGADGEVLTRPDDAFLRGASGSSVRTIYLDGFGALVFVKVSFPLLAAPAVEQPAAGPAVDSEWNRAKQEMLAERRKALSLDSVSGQPYDAAQVETLKTQILSALKDAAKARTIQPADFVVVTVFGPPAMGSAKNSPTEMRGTVLTIRVKKSDIDMFAADKLDADKFRGKTTMTAYVGNGYGVTSVNSWAKSGSLQIR